MSANEEFTETAAMGPARRTDEASQTPAAATARPTFASLTRNITPHEELWRRRRSETVVTYLRWVVLLACTVSIDRAEAPGWLLPVPFVVAVYAALGVAICRNVVWYVRWGGVYGVASRALDVALVLGAVWAFNGAGRYGFVASALLFVVFGTSVVYRLNAGLFAGIVCGTLFWFVWSRLPYTQYSTITLGEYVSAIAVLCLSAILGELLARDHVRDARLRGDWSQLARLYEFGASSAHDGNLDAFADTILRLAIQLTRADRGSVMVSEDGGQSLRIYAAHGLSEDVIESTRVARGERISGYVLATGEALLLYDPNRDPRFQGAPLVEGVACSLSVPIAAHSGVVGVLNVAAYDGGANFGEDELRLTTLLATHIGAAIENQRLFEELRAQAQTDVLTGLYNRRHILNVLNIECGRAKRYQYPLGLMMVDIDRFKQVNDRFGHLAGDMVLRELASLLLANTRASDISARFGGEEFLVILPHTRVEGAALACERLRQAVENHSFANDEWRIGKVTVSCGVVAADDGALSPQELIARADELLYQAKEGGRNRTVAAGVGASSVKT